MKAKRKVRVLLLFAGIGGGALGFLQAQHPELEFVICGAVDFDPIAARDFERLTGHKCHVGDISLMQPADLHAVCDGMPDVVFTSPPCKSFSGCLPAATAATPKYIDMSNLAVRGLFLALEAWPGHVPRLILMENVPRIQNRGRHLLDVITGMLKSYGYACRETVRNCGELGGLAQRRRRFLLVARDVGTTVDWWREPRKQSMRAVGEVFSQLPLPLPGADGGGPMHRLPNLSPKNWLRLALIPAGGDWRDLPESVRLAERAGRQNGGFGIEDWTEPGHTVLGEGTVRNVRASVADPRLECEPRNGVMGVVDDGGPAGTVIGHADVHANAAAVADSRVAYPDAEDDDAFMAQVAELMDARDRGDRDAELVALAKLGHADPRPAHASRAGAIGVRQWEEPGYTVIGHDPRGMKGSAIADPRLSDNPGRHSTKRAVADWRAPSPTVMGAGARDSGTGAPSIADPRLSDRPGRHEAKYRVVDPSGPAGTVIASDRVGSGAPSVADPRLSLRPDRRSGERGVGDWSAPSGTVIGHADANASVHVADPRVVCERHEGGHGVVGWDGTSYCLIGHPTIHNWPGQVADPRGQSFEVGYIVKGPAGLELRGIDLDLEDRRPMAKPPIILSLDGTWHRPMTDLELAMLQSFPSHLDGEWLTLSGSRGKRREGIGNAVPVATARAIAETALQCLANSDKEIITTSGEPIWVSPGAEVPQSAGEEKADA